MVKAILRRLLAGFVTGLGVLGVGGRMVMRILAMVAGRPVHFSIGASAGIALIGAILGTVASVPLIALTSRRAWRSPLAGGMYGPFLYLLLIPFTPAPILEEVNGLGGHMLAVIALFGIVFVMYGVVLEQFMRRGPAVIARVAPA